MDIGKFKASQTRLIIWILVPPLVVVGVGLSSYALQLQSEWRLNRTKGLSDVLPKLVQTQARSGKLIDEFEGAGAIQSEDELISYLQNVAQGAGFTVDSLKVARRASVPGLGMPVLTASVKGSGRYEAIEAFLGDVTANQHLLSESSLQVTRNARGAYEQDACRADITFELVLFDALKKSGGVR